MDNLIPPRFREGIFSNKATPSNTVTNIANLPASNETASDNYTIGNKDQIGHEVGYTGLTDTTQIGMPDDERCLDKSASDSVISGSATYPMDMSIDDQQNPSTLVFPSHTEQLVRNATKIVVLKTKNSDKKLHQDRSNALDQARRRTTRIHESGIYSGNNPDLDETDEHQARSEFLSQPTLARSRKKAVSETRANVSKKKEQKPVAEPEKKRRPGRPRKKPLQTEAIQSPPRNEPPAPEPTNFQSVSDYSFPVVVKPRAILDKSGMSIEAGNEDVPGSSRNQRDHGDEKINPSVTDNDIHAGTVEGGIHHVDHHTENEAAASTIRRFPFPDGAVILKNRKIHCNSCQSQSEIVMVKDKGHCYKCGEMICESTPETSHWLRPPWEALGVKTFFDIDPETGLLEERVITRTGKRPKTMEFHMDLWIAGQADRSSNIDFKTLCLNLIRVRQQNTIPKLTQATPNGNASMVPQDLPVPPFGKAPLKNREGTMLLEESHWDYMLAEVRAKGKTMRGVRAWRLRGRNCAGGWAVWETRQRRASRGEFVEDRPGSSAWIVHKANKDDEVVKELRLGYRRRGIDRGDGVFEEVPGDHWIEPRQLRRELARAREGT